MPNHFKDEEAANEVKFTTLDLVSGQNHTFMMPSVMPRLCFLDEPNLEHIQHGTLDKPLRFLHSRGNQQIKQQLKVYKTHQK